MLSTLSTIVTFVFSTTETHFTLFDFSIDCLRHLWVARRKTRGWCFIWLLDGRRLSTKREFGEHEILKKSNCLYREFCVNRQLKVDDATVCLYKIKLFKFILDLKKRGRKWRDNNHWEWTESPFVSAQLPKLNDPRIVAKKLHRGSVQMPRPLIWE